MFKKVWPMNGETKSHGHKNGYDSSMYEPNILLTVNLKNCVRTSQEGERTVPGSTLMVSY